MPATTVVLVHGSWHGGWCWDRVRPILEGKGLPVETIDLPSCGPRGTTLSDLDDDIQAIRNLLDRVDGQILLCAHSYGGAPATVAAVGLERVLRIVYLAAFMVDAGESCTDIRGGGELPNWCVVADDGTFSIDPAAAPEVLYTDCDAVTREWAIARLVPQTERTSRQPVRAAAWHTIPSTYVQCTLDRAIPPAIQRRLSARAGETLELATSHSPFLSQPDRVADILAVRAG